MVPNGLGICPLGEGDAGGCFNGFEFGEAHGMGAASSRPFVGASEMDEQDGSEVTDRDLLCDGQTSPGRGCSFCVNQVQLLLDGLVSAAQVL